MNEYWDEQDEAARAERLASEPAQEWDDWAMHSELTAPPHMPKRWRMTITVAGEGDSSSYSVHLTREREMGDDGGGAGSVIPTGSTMPRVNTRIPGLQPPSPSKAPRE